MQKDDFERDANFLHKKWFECNFLSSLIYDSFLGAFRASSVTVDDLAWYMHEARISIRFHWWRNNEHVKESMKSDHLFPRACDIFFHYAQEERM